MNIDTLSRKKYLQRLSRMLLSVALVFTLFHVSSHDFDFSAGGSDTEECQVCRVNHQPFDLSSVSTAIIPLFLLALTLVSFAFKQPSLSYKYTLGARAPPLF